MGSTPKYGLPYPEADTLITDSAAIVQELAEKIDTALSAVTASDSYTIPGALVQDFTASGTFTPPAGVSVVHVVIIGGGGGGTYYNNGDSPGGSGGSVRVFRSVPVTGPVAVTVGGSNTASSFGALTASAGWRPQAGDVLRVPWSTNMVPTDDPTVRPSAGGVSVHTSSAWYSGYDGVQVNGTYYAGGGGGGAVTNGGARGGGGQGGGGAGAMFGGSTPPARGANGFGGGGGGGSYTGTTLGGSGRVMVYTEQAYKSAHGTRPAPDPTIVAAIDDHDQVLGVYAVDPAAPDLPGVPHARLVDYPTDTIDTGRTVTVPDDPNDPNSRTTDAPVLAWPEAGWTYTDTDEWKEPTP